MRILLIEDDERLASFARGKLHSEGFTVDWVGCGEEAEAALSTTRFDAVILDLGLPDMDGQAILKGMRACEDTTPVLILTARDALEDRLIGLNAGADDYLPKPFALAELVARVRALLRRPGAALGVTLKAGNIAFDTVSRETVIDNGVVSLSRREIDALECLMRRLGRVVPRSVLEETLYGYQETIGSNSVEVLIHRLRKRLEAANATADVHTIRGVGYILAERPSHRAAG